MSVFVTSDTEGVAWSKLRNMDSSMESAIQTHQSSQNVTHKRPPVIGMKQRAIDWDYWKGHINHTSILECMMESYENQLRAAETAEKIDSSKFVKDNTLGWNLYSDTLEECTQVVRLAESKMDSGAKVLWMSHRSPPVWRVDTNEWVESDQYWQAFIEKHHHYNPGQDASDPESQTEIDKVKTSWHTRVAKFNERSVNPMLYGYMDQLPSFEFYDIHRQAFLEHMAYFLLRTGSPHRLFPECPPWQWLSHIETLRHKFIAVCHRHRSHYQLANLGRDRDMPMHPHDVEHGGELFYSSLISSDKAATEKCVARLMASFSFVCSPYIAVQSQGALQLAMAVDGGKGKVYSFGEDVPSLHYLPESASPTPRPKEALFAYMDHLAIQGVKLDVGYATMLDIATDVLEERGDHWFNCPNEMFCDAFIRRLDSEEPSRPVYEEYVTELKDRMNNATPLLDSRSLAKKMALVESMSKTLNSMILETTMTSTGASAEATKIVSDPEAVKEGIQKRTLMVFDPQGHPVTDVDVLVEDIRTLRS